MRSPCTHRTRAAGLLVLALGLAACSSPTPNRPQDAAPGGESGGGSAETPAAPSSSGSFRTDPISGGPEVWDELYGTAPPDEGYPPKRFEAPTQESPYPGPDGDPGDADEETSGTAAAPAEGAPPVGSASPTAAPTKSGG